MKLPRRNFLYLAAGAAALPMSSRFACAQTYPSRPVRMIVGRWVRHHRTPARAMDDGTARPAIHHREPAGREHQHCHRGGRAGARRRYTLLLLTSSGAINATLYDKLNYDLIRGKFIAEEVEKWA